MMLLSSGRLVASTVTFSAGEEFIYTLIFVIYTGVSNDTHMLTPWIRSGFLAVTTRCQEAILDPFGHNATIGR